MLRHVMSCDVMARLATSCHVMPRHVMSRRFTSCHVMARHVTSKVTGRSHDQRFIVKRLFPHAIISNNRVRWFSRRVPIPYRISGIWSSSKLEFWEMTPGENWDEERTSIDEVSIEEVYVDLGTDISKDYQSCHGRFPQWFSVWNPTSFERTQTMVDCNTRRKMTAKIPRGRRIFF